MAYRIYDSTGKSEESRLNNRACIPIKQASAAAKAMAGQDRLSEKIMDY